MGLLRLLPRLLGHARINRDMVPRLVGHLLVQSCICWDKCRDMVGWQGNLAASCWTRRFLGAHHQLLWSRHGQLLDETDPLHALPQPDRGRRRRVTEGHDLRVTRQQLQPRW